MAKKFRDLADKARRGPGAAEEIERHKTALRTAMRLTELRQHAGKTQVELAAIMDVTQENVSRIERAEDAQLSTIERYVRALGGHLELTAVIGNEVIPLGVPSKRGPKG